MGTRAGNAEVRRQQILEAAAAVISERGLGEARIADVAAVAETSTGLILYYFGSKDQLLAEALAAAEDQFYLQIFRGITGIDDPRAQLAELIAGSCPGTERVAVDVTAEWQLWVELWARALHDPDTARRRAGMDRRWRSTIADVVRAGQQRGVFAAHVDPRDFALEFAALIDGLALQVALRDTEVTGEQMERIALGHARRVLEFHLDEVPVR